MRRALIVLALCGCENQIELAIGIANAETGTPSFGVTAAGAPIEFINHLRVRECEDGACPAPDDTFFDAVGDDVMWETAAQTEDGGIAPAVPVPVFYGVREAAPGTEFAFFTTPKELVTGGYLVGVSLEDGATKGVSFATFETP